MDYQHIITIVPGKRSGKPWIRGLRITVSAGLVDARCALDGVEVYVGDGAALSRPTLRQRDDALTGHASIAMQLDRCRDRGVRRAVFTHCGSAIGRSTPADETPHIRGS